MVTDESNNNQKVGKTTLNSESYNAKWYTEATERGSAAKLTYRSD